MKKTILFLILFCVVFLGCQIEKTSNFHEIDFYDSTSFTVTLLNPIKQNIGYSIIKGDTFVFVNDTAIFALNYKSNTYLFDFKLPKYFVDVCYHNNDSIFVIADPYNTHIDSIIRLMNYKGEIVKYYTFNFNEILDSNNNLTTHPIDLVYKNNKLIITFKRLWFDVNESARTSLIGESYFLNKKTPLVGVFDLKKEEINFVDLYVYPILGLENRINSGYFRQNINLYSDSSVLLSFSYTSIIYEIDIYSGQLEEYNPKSFVLDTFPLNEKLIMTQPIYGIFLTASSSNIFFRRIMYARGKYFGGYLFFDKYFNVLGEFVTPLNTTVAYTNDEFVYLFDGRLPYTDSSFSITRYKYRFKEGNLDQWLDDNELRRVKEEVIEECNYQSGSIINTDLKLYIDKYIQDTSFSVIIAPIGLTCPGCVDFVLKNYMANQTVFAGYEIYLLAVGLDSVSVYSKLGAYLINTQSNYVATDTSADLLNFEKGYIGVRYLIIKKNKVVFDKTYEFDELENIMLEGVSSYIDSIKAE